MSVWTRLFQSVSSESAQRHELIFITVHFQDRGKLNQFNSSLVTPFLNFGVYWSCVNAHNEFVRMEEKKHVLVSKKNVRNTFTPCRREDTRRRITVKSFIDVSQWSTMGRSDQITTITMKELVSLVRWTQNKLELTGWEQKETMRAKVQPRTTTWAKADRSMFSSQSSSASKWRCWTQAAGVCVTRRAGGTTNQQAAGCAQIDSFHLLQMEAVCIFTSSTKLLILKLKSNYSVPAESPVTLDLKRNPKGKSRNLIRGDFPWNEMCAHSDLSPRKWSQDVTQPPCSQIKGVKLQAGMHPAGRGSTSVLSISQQ